MAEVLDKLFQNNALLKMVFTSRLCGYEGLKTQDQSVYHNIETLKSMVSGRLSALLDDSGWVHNSIRGGNAQLPLRIAKMLSDRIHLQKVLARVSNENKKIKLSFVDGSDAYCEKLVLAVPAPVYSSIEFEPDVVPQQQLQAIQSVQCGTNQKVLVPTSRPHIGYDGTMITEKLVSFFNLAADVLIMYFLRPEDLSFFDEQLLILQKGYTDVGEGTQTLVQAEDRQLIKYDSAVTHCWLADPYAQGSFSGYNALLSSSLDNKVSYKGIVIKEIFQPVKERVFFVGEHTTILNEVGTMEAAVESGERMARLF
jgi:monoamine oxidase